MRWTGLSVERAASVSAKWVLAKWVLAKRKGRAMGRRRDERREFPRGQVVASTVGIQNGGFTSRYVVDDLSAGGALLRGQGRLEPGESIRLLMELPRSAPFGLDARVVRARHGTNGECTVGVTFDHRDDGARDLIHDVVMDALAEGNGPAVLIVEDEPRLRRELEREVALLGHRVRSASTPLNVLRWLEDETERVDAVLIDCALGAADALGLTTFVATEYPEVRRVVVQRDTTASRSPRAATETPFHDPVLAAPWDWATLDRLLA